MKVKREVPVRRQLVAVHEHAVDDQDVVAADRHRRPVERGVGTHVVHRGPDRLAAAERVEQGAGHPVVVVRVEPVADRRLPAAAGSGSAPGPVEAVTEARTTVRPWTTSTAASSSAKTVLPAPPRAVHTDCAPAARPAAVAADLQRSSAADSALRTAARGWPASRRTARDSGRSAAAGRPGAASRRTSRAGEQLAQRVAELALEPAPAAARGPRSPRPASGSPRPAPQHGAQLVLGVEADPVVDAVARARRPIGSRWPPLRSALLTTASKTRHPAQRRRRRRGRAAARSTVSSTSIQSWHHARPERPVAQHRRRHDVPAGGLARPGRPRPRARPACRPGSPTAAARRGPACRRRPAVTPSSVERAVQRGVAGVDEPALDLEVAVAQQAQRLARPSRPPEPAASLVRSRVSGGSPFWRGQTWPSGPAAARTAGTAAGRRRRPAGPAR